MSRDLVRVRRRLPAAWRRSGLGLPAFSFNTLELTGNIKAPDRLTKVVCVSGGLSTLSASAPPIVLAFRDVGMEEQDDLRPRSSKVMPNVKAMARCPDPTWFVRWNH